MEQGPKADLKQFSFDGIIKFLKLNPALISQRRNKIIAFRSAISTILKMPADIGQKNENFRFRVTKFKSHLYISNVEPFLSQSKKDEIKFNQTFDSIYRLNFISGKSCVFR